jgi:hypothetical protein
MGQRPLREDVPISLPPVYKDEALRLRNRLLMFRFRRHGDTAVEKDLVDRAIEPRLNQIFVPLLSVIDDAAVKNELQNLARAYNRELVAERGMDAEAQILEIIRDVLARDVNPTLSVKEIASWFAERQGADYERKVTPKWIGGLIRRRLGLRTRKSDGVFIVPREDYHRGESPG